MPRTPEKFRDMLHEEMHREHGLISNRISWYVTSQAFLMTAFAASGSQGHDFRWLANWFLPALGFVISLLIAKSVHAALRAMGLLQGEVKKLFDNNMDLEKAPFGIRTPDIHSEGMLAPTWIPRVFMLAWFVAFVMANCKAIGVTLSLLLCR